MVLDITTAEELDKAYSIKMKKWMKKKMANSMEKEKQKDQISMQETKAKFKTGRILICLINFCLDMCKWCMGKCSLFFQVFLYSPYGLGNIVACFVVFTIGSIIRVFLIGLKLEVFALICGHSVRRFSH